MVPLSSGKGTSGTVGATVGATVVGGTVVGGTVVTGTVVAGTVVGGTVVTGTVVAGTVIGVAVTGTAVVAGIVVGAKVVVTGGVDTVADAPVEGRVVSDTNTHPDNNTAAITAARTMRQDRQREWNIIRNLIFFGKADIL